MNIKSSYGNKSIKIIIFNKELFISYFLPASAWLPVIIELGDENGEVWRDVQGKLLVNIFSA